MKTIVVGMLFSSLVLVGVACSSSPFVDLGRCAEDAPFPDPECIEKPDAGADADADASQARAECLGRCMPRRSGSEGGNWSQDPVSVWTGPKSAMPTCCPGYEGCEKPGETPVAYIPTETYRLYDQIIAPPAECEPCECGASDGVCTKLPEAIEIHSEICWQSGGSTLSFNGPAGWDGSCNADGALAAGALCNGVPCARSVWSPALPGPVSEACAPKAAVPTFTAPAVDWQLGLLACEGPKREEPCEGERTACYEDPGPGWMYCVYQKGDVEDVCPVEYSKQRIVMYANAPRDERGCEACSCGAPMGSGCLGTIPLYKDGACQVESTKLLVSSMGPNCVGLQPPGIALGSKAFTGLDYMPGVCEAAGGAPKGSATADPTRAVTFCCGSSFWDIE